MKCTRKKIKYIKVKWKTFNYYKINGNIFESPKNYGESHFIKCFVQKSWDLKDFVWRVGNKIRTLNDFRLPPHCKFGLQSSVALRSFWWLVADVRNNLRFPISKGYAVHVKHLTLKYENNMLCRNVGNSLPRTQIRIFLFTVRLYGWMKLSSW